MPRLCAVVIALTLVAGCGSASNPTTPTPNGNTLQLTGTVRTGGLPLTNATVKILDGPNQNKATTTDAGGHYALTLLAAGGFTLEVSAAGYATVTKGITLTATISTDVDLIPNPRAVLVAGGDAQGVLQPDGSYAFTFDMTNTGDGCAGAISGSIRLTTAAGVVVATITWTVPPSLIVRPGGHAPYTVNGITAADAFAATLYTTAFSYSTVTCP